MPSFLYYMSFAFMFISVISFWGLIAIVVRKRQNQHCSKTTRISFSIALLVISVSAFFSLVLIYSLLEGFEERIGEIGLVNVMSVFIIMIVSGSIGSLIIKEYKASLVASK